MSWNDAGDNNQPNDPWNKNRNRSPGGLDEWLANLMEKLKKIGYSNNKNSGGPTSFYSYTGYLIFVAIVLVIWGLSGLYLVNPAEKSVILRFGKFVDVGSPGLHWIARFIETKYLVDVQKIYSFSLDGDFLTKASDQADVPHEVADVDVKNSITTNSDQSKNLVNVELNVQYRIIDPKDYLFNVVNPNETVQQVAAGALSAVIGQMKLDDVLTTGREFLSSKVFEATKQVLSNYNAGVDVVAVTLRKVQAPDQVRAAFNDVNRADQDKATYIQQAQAYASKIIPLAQGAAARTLADATGYQQKVLLTAQANIAKYQAILSVYATAPEITRERMYLETIQNILNHTTKILVDFNNSNNLIYLPLDKLFVSGKQPEIMNAAPSMTTSYMPQDVSMSTANVEVSNETN